MVRDQSVGAVMDRPLSERIATHATDFLGSMRFIVLQTVVIVLWIVVNVWGLIGRWDPYPFILLNLLFSTQAAYAAPLILLAQNRQAARDRDRDDREATEMEEVDTLTLKQMDLLLSSAKALNEHKVILEKIADDHALLADMHATLMRHE